MLGMFFFLTGFFGAVLFGAAAAILGWGDPKG